MDTSSSLNLQLYSKLNVHILSFMYCRNEQSLTMGKQKHSQLHKHLVHRPSPTQFLATCVTFEPSDQEAEVVSWPDHTPSQGCGRSTRLREAFGQAVQRSCMQLKRYEAM